MEAEKEPLSIKLRFEQGDPGDVKGKAFIYTVEPSGLVTVYAATNLADFKTKKLIPHYQIYDVGSKPTFLAAEFPAGKEEDMLGGLEDVVRVTDIKGNSPGIRLVLGGLLHYSKLADEQAQKRVSALSVVRRVRRYYEVPSDDLVGYITDMFVDPILEALGNNDQIAIDRRMEELNRFSNGSPFVDTVEDFRKYVRSTTIIPEIDVIAMYVGLMSAKLNMENASRDDTQLERAAKFRDEVRALSAGIEKSRVK